MWMIAGIGVIVVGLVVVALIANSGRISSNTGNDLTEAGFEIQKRNACITNLVNEADGYRGQIMSAVLKRLVVLDGRNPETGALLYRVEDGEGKLISDPEVQRILSFKYDKEGLDASKRLAVVTEKLTQPKLNQLCGEPITDKSRLEGD